MAVLGAIVVFICLLTMLGFVLYGYKTFPGRLSFLCVIIYTLSPAYKYLGFWNILAILVINVASMVIETHFREKGDELE